jgi:hypothetical protein
MNQTLDLLAHGMHTSVCSGRPGMKSRAESWKSPLKGTQRPMSAVGFSRLDTTQPGNSFRGDHDGTPSPLTCPTKKQVHASPLPLAGVRVIDLTTFWAGPFAACYLAAVGADVVKVESIQRPDGMRFAGAIPKEQLWEWSAVFAGANAGKRAITLNLATPEGIELLRRLIRDADVIMDNFSVRVLEQFGLTWDAVRGLTGPGVTGPASP